MSNVTSNLVMLAHTKRELAEIKKEKKKHEAKIKEAHARWICSLQPASKPYGNVKWKYKELNSVICSAMFAHSLPHLRNCSREWGILCRNMRLFNLHTILEVLLTKGFNAHEIASVTHIPLSTVYYHLRKIKNNSPVKHNPDHLYDVKNALSQEIIILKPKKRQYK